MNQPDTRPQKSPASPWVYGLGLAALLFVLLLPFAGKAFHIDDTFYVRVGADFLRDPLHPYNSTLNWDGKEESLWKISLHPPLHSYLMAGALLFVGENEIPLHVVWALLAAGCTYLMFQIARQLCTHPVMATLLAVLCPGFFVSATTLMADISLLFFWLLAVYFAILARNTNRPGFLWLAAVCSAAAAMTKYFGIALVPLLSVWLAATIWMSRREGKLAISPAWIAGWLAVSCLPVMVVSAWGFYAKAQPECGLFHPLAAARFSTSEQHSMSEQFALSEDAGNEMVDGVRVALSFLGGSLVWPLFLLPACRFLSGWLKMGLVAMLLFTIIAGWYAISFPDGRQIDFSYVEITDAMTFAGSIAVVIAIASCIARRDGDSLLLGLWFFGTLFFCSFINWSVNVRVILLAIFPLCVLVVRWGESLKKSQSWLLWTKIAVGPTLLVSLIVAIADYDFASVGREFAQTTVRELIQSGEQVTFAGHWGFQYYMEKEGAQPIDFDADLTLNEQRGYYLNKSGIMIYPLNNARLNPRMYNIALIEEVNSSLPRFGVHSMCGQANAGFYSSVWGTVPYNIDPEIPVDAFSVYRIVE
ncbi:Dolichyl-phosphate-mannose-protein mannosyltransferase [Symmachiella dynata]|uniref:ArnT family glycosyltransferase n=1 Tax=Symmachiella dynata TaxID=2527995 RepID=UPI0011897CF9|nr:glycosyltransferase family 39 protein [Symmachiella dynata]QDT49900.1 Dolichyl-phosphate-mannose-protein mannosyltransferase [Symmachiella dynata]